MRIARLRMRLAIIFTAFSMAASACTAVTEQLDSGDPASDVGDTGTGNHPDADATVTSKDGDADATVMDTGSDVIDAKPDVVDGSDADGSDALSGDAADALAPQGSPCATPGTIEQRPCGFCGTQMRICLDLGAGPVWQAWGSCNGEVKDGCVAGTTFLERCGNCGQRQVQCTSTCTKVVGLCSEPANACEPGFIEYAEALSCDAGTGRTRKCDDPPADGGPGGCSWGNYSLTCVSAPTELLIPTNIGDAYGTAFKLTGSTPRVVQNATDGGCYLYGSGYNVVYAYIKVRNSNSKAALVTIWGTPQWDAGTNGMMLYAYPPTPNPVTDWATCTAGDYCTSSTYCALDSGLYNGFGLKDDGGISARPLVPAGGEILLFVSSYPYTTVPVDQDVRMYVRLDELK